MTTVHIAIGNSDDRLTQATWAAYHDDVDVLLRTVALEGHGTLHGAWLSESSSAYQNAAWAFEPDQGPGSAWDGLRALLRTSLQDIAARYDQHSIAWGEAETDFLTPTRPAR